MEQGSLLPDSSQRFNLQRDCGSGQTVKCAQVEARGVMLSGTVQRYFEDIKLGTIKSDDQQSYAFKRIDWISATAPRAGMKVYFELDKNKPIKIQTDEESGQLLQA